MFSSNTSQVSSDATYIEDVFSTWLYTGNGSTQTITNGIDLAGEGGLVWLKRRDSTSSQVLVDSQRGISKFLRTNSTDAESTSTTNITAFNADGFSLGTATNVNSATYASWTFRKQPKFFDVVTYTGDGTNNRQISHSLASVPGCVIVKRLNAVTDWLVWHRSSGAGFNAATLNGTGTFGSSGFGPSTAFTDTYFTVANQAETNASGGTYVAYIFAHNAGGFGLTGTDNVISCGSFTTDGSGNATVNLGWEPQWILTKRSDSSTDGDWYLVDNMRGLSGYWTTAQNLKAQSTAAETSGYSVSITSTGFQKLASDANRTQIYIAIRRGPMKTPTTGTSVFSPNAFTSSGTSGASFGVGFPSDLFIFKNRGQSVDPFNFRFIDRLRGNNPYLISSSTAAEVSWVNTNSLFTSRQNDIVVNTNSTIINGSGESYIYWLMRRAPGFFDVVCYTGTLATLNVTHGLQAVPQLIITKARSSTGNWTVQPLSDGTKRLRLNTINAEATDSGPWDNTNPTSSVFTLGADTGTNSSGVTYVAYLFASCPGVSKVGSYTGGSGQVINCGFSSGARFVLIKRTDSAGNWYVWDSARGITVSSDPYLLLNSTAAEATSDDYLSPASSGFEINAGGSPINESGGTYIYLAIA